MFQSFFKTLKDTFLPHSGVDTYQISISCNCWMYNPPLKICSVDLYKDLQHLGDEPWPNTSNLILYSSSVQINERLSNTRLSLKCLQTNSVQVYRKQQLILFFFFLGFSSIMIEIWSFGKLSFILSSCLPQRFYCILCLSKENEKKMSFIILSINLTDLKG